MKKLKSLTIFFPFFNDAGTVEKAIFDAYFYGKRLTQNLEVIAIHGGKSRDNTLIQIVKQKNKYPGLVIVDKTDNREGYAVIKHGFKKATKDWLFYTDGDLQYRLEDLQKLVIAQLKTGADVINGYRVNRQDSIIRILFGSVYNKITKRLFNPPIRDLTCDFRLIRRSFLKKITLEAHDASILLELIKKLQYSGAKFAEVKVKHWPRVYGKSNYNIWNLLKERVAGDLKTFSKHKKNLYNRIYENSGDKISCLP